jgi:tRNA A37 threonylcarbamoyladenosine dehydratase
MIADDPRFGGISRLYGRAGLERLSDAHICVIGVGGVGSWTVEGLVRSAIGGVTMVDLDEVCLTNTNRQLPAIDGAVGRPKVAVLQERMNAISPACKVRAIAEFFLEASADHVLSQGFDWVIDAIDHPAQKAFLISECKRRGIQVLTVGGAGGRRDGTQVRVADLAKTGNDALLKILRRDLRKDYGFPRNAGMEFGVPCVYSGEPQVYPWSDGRVCEEKEGDGGAMRLDCASGFGAASFVTAAFGFAAAGEVVRRVALAEHRGEDLGAGWIRGERVGDARKNMDGLYGKGSA